MPTGGESTGLESDRPDAPIGRIVDEQAKPILDLPFGGFGDDQLLLVGGHLGLRRQASSGGDCPTSTLALFTRASSSASSSEVLRASTLARADTRPQ